MRGTGNRLSVFCLAAALVMALAAPAAAFPILTITPGTGDSVDVSVTNLEEPTGGFAFILDFDDAALDGVSYTVGPEFGFYLDNSAGFTGGSGSPLSLDIASMELSAVLAGMQGNPAVGSPVSFVLANIVFNGDPDPFLGSFSLRGAQLSDVDGLRLIPFGSVPEPGTLALLGGGLAMALARRRARRQ